MKDFKEFRQTLTADVLDEINTTALDYRDKCLNEQFAEDDLEGRYAAHQQYYTESFIISVLEQYHKWLND